MGTTAGSIPTFGRVNSILALAVGTRVMVDTNIWVFVSTTRSPLHLSAVEMIRDLRLAGMELCTSRQILREYASALTRPQRFSTAIPSSVVSGNVSKLARQLTVVEDGPHVFAEWLNLLQTHPTGGKQVHDANITATMIAHGIYHLLTDNTADFQRFSSIIAIHPLV